MRVTKYDLFEDIAVLIESWTAANADALAMPNADLRWIEERGAYQRIHRALEIGGAERDDVKKVFAECLRGFAISILTAIDGGTALSEKGRIYLVDRDGTSLGEGLHDGFASHLLDTGRLQ